LHLWKPGDPIPLLGQRLLIGVATYSIGDLHLLDLLNSRINPVPTSPIHIDTFNVLELDHWEADIPKYIPDMKEFFQTPLMGLWVDGRLTYKGEGFAAKTMILSFFSHFFGEQKATVNRWNPGEPIPHKGTRFLIGVSPTSLPDQKLLSDLEAALSRSAPLTTQVDFFNAVDCKTQDELNRYIPQLPQVFQSSAYLLGLWTPVVGM
jgi:hypothetical protein